MCSWSAPTWSAPSAERHAPDAFWLSTDSFFGNVCELDLLFNFHKVYSVLDEVFLAGEIQETSKSVVLSRLEALEALP